MSSFFLFPSMSCIIHVMDNWPRAVRRLLCSQPARVVMPVTTVLTEHAACVLQLAVLTIIAATLLIRPVMKPDSLEIGELFVAMPFGLLVGLMMDNFSEMAMLVESQPVFFRCYLLMEQHNVLTAACRLAVTMTCMSIALT